MYTRAEAIKQLLWLIGNSFSSGSEWTETKKSLKLAHDRQEQYGEYGYQEIVRRASGAMPASVERYKFSFLSYLNCFVFISIN